MACKSCGSDNQREFGAEINIHFPGREALDKPARRFPNSVSITLLCELQVPLEAVHVYLIFLIVCGTASDEPFISDQERRRGRA